MNAAIVTVTAMNQGLIAGGPPCVFPGFGRDAVCSAMSFPLDVVCWSWLSRWITVSANLDCSFDVDTWTQIMVRILALLDADAYRKALHDLYVVAACVLRRK